MRLAGRAARSTAGTPTAEHGHDVSKSTCRGSGSIDPKARVTGVISGCFATNLVTEDWNHPHLEPSVFPKPTFSSFALLSYLWYTLFAMRNRLLFRLGLLCSREGQMSSHNDRRAPGTAHRRLGKRGRDELPKVSQDTIQLYPRRPDPGRLWSNPASTHGHIDARARHPQPQPASCPAHVDTGGTNADTPTDRASAAFSHTHGSSAAAHLAILPRPDQDQHHL